MNRFSASTQHIILNESNTCMGSVAVHRIQHQLHLLNQELFPVLGDKGSLSENVFFIAFNSHKLKIFVYREQKFR